MKLFTKISLLVLIISITSCVNNAPKENHSSAKAVDNSVTKIELIDFYGTHRCVTCKSIEANAMYTVNTFFANEQKDGKLVFKTINVDDPINYSVAESFQASGTALFLNIIKDGKEKHVNLTNFAFSNGKNKEVFAKELKVKLETELKKL